MNVNPEILIWAREERGMKVEDVAKKLKLKVSDLKVWESTGEGLSFSQLSKLAKEYKRQTAVFFLATTPPSTKKPKDFRNVAGVRGLFSINTLLAIRRTNRYLEVAREVADSTYWRKQYDWTKDFSGKKNLIDKDAHLMRVFLTTHEDRQISPKDPEEAFRLWRKKVEERLGIFVFQFKMQEDEISGFSYAFEDFPYAIVINSGNSAVKKNFTLFHEVGHIIRHNPGACKVEGVDERKLLEIEQDCNQFAGKMLAPRKLLKSTLDVENIFKFGRELNISGEAYLRRLHEEKLITPEDFYDLLGPVRDKSNSLPRREKTEDDDEFLITRVNLSKSSRGGKFFELVSNASATNRISYSTAADLLGIKVGYIK